MSEYIVSLSEGKDNDALKAYGWNGSYLCGYELTGEVVRCGDCQYYEDTGNCNWFVCSSCGMLAEVTPDGYCAWGERKENGK